MIKTVAVSASQPTWQQVTPITGMPDGGQLMIGFQCTNMPTDGFVALSVPGPDAADSVNIPKMQITYPSMSVFSTVVWPPNYSTQATLSYWAGATAPAAGASITLQLLLPVSPGQYVSAGTTTYRFS